MPIEVTCQSCSGQFRLPDSAAGKKIRCPKCKRPIEVPAAKAPVFSMAMDETSVLPPAPLPPAPLPPAPLPPAPKTPVPLPPAPRPPADEWHLKTADGEEYGPVPRSELDDWFREGRITAECQILGGLGQQWQPAADVFQLNGAAERVAPQAAADDDAEEGPSDPLAAEIEQPLPNFQAAPTKSPARSKKAAPAAGAAVSADRSQRSRIVAGFLGVFLGPLGIHRFYLGYWGVGLAMLFTGGGLVLWSLIDSIFVMVGRVPDADGRPLSD